MPSNAININFKKQILCHTDNSETRIEENEDRRSMNSRFSYVCFSHKIMETKAAVVKNKFKSAVNKEEVQGVTQVLTSLTIGMI